MYCQKKKSVQDVSTTHRVGPLVSSSSFFCLSFKFGRLFVNLLRRAMDGYERRIAVGR